MFCLFLLISLFLKGQAVCKVHEANDLKFVVDSYVGW